MAPRTEKQYEEIREYRKALIQESALELFATKGYQSTTISMIAKKAGISKGLVYNYFDSKEELLNIIIEDGLQKILLMADPNQDGEMTSDELSDLIHESFRMLETHPRFWSLYFSLLPQVEIFSLIRDKFIDIYKQLTQMMAGFFIKKGAEDPEAEAIILGSLLDGIFINYTFNRENYPIEAVKKKLLDIYCNN